MIAAFIVAAAIAATSGQITTNEDHATFAQLQKDAVENNRDFAQVLDGSTDRNFSSCMSFFTQEAHDNAATSGFIYDFISTDWSMLDKRDEASLMLTAALEMQSFHLGVPDATEYINKMMGACQQYPSAVEAGRRLLGWYGRADAAYVDLKTRIVVATSDLK